jgi:hypothetical protein
VACRLAIPGLGRYRLHCRWNGAERHNPQHVGACTLAASGSRHGSLRDSRRTEPGSRPNMQRKACGP